MNSNLLNAFRQTESIPSATPASKTINQSSSRETTINSPVHINARKMLNQAIFIVSRSILSMNVSDAIKDSSWIRRKSAGNEIHTKNAKNIILPKINVKNARLVIFLRRYSRKTPIQCWDSARSLIVDSKWKIAENTNQTQIYVWNVKNTLYKISLSLSLMRLQTLVKMSCVWCVRILMWRQDNAWLNMLLTARNTDNKKYLKTNRWILWIHLLLLRSALNVKMGTF